jgi:hypothetical protein
MKLSFNKPLLLLVLLCALPATLKAQWEYTVNNGNITITGYTGSGGAVTIPITINVSGVNLPVTSIADYALEGCKATSIVIPGSVSSIGAYAFSGSAMTSLTIGGGVSSIGQLAVQYCLNLTNVTMVNGITSIGYGMFYDCPKLSSITIPDSVTSIGDLAFFDCTSLMTATIGTNVTSIVGEAFDGCTSLMAIYFRGNVPSLSPVNSGNSGAFYRDSAILYYLPGTIGWYTPFGGLQAVLYAGSLQVSISPQGAVSAGAEWRVDGGAWQSSGTTVANLAVGTHTAAFSTVTGWETPASQNVTVTLNQTTTTTATYLPPHAAIGTAILTNGFMVAILITDAGFGYTNAPLIRLVGGGSSGAQAVAVVSNGMVTAVTVLNPGAGYTSPPIVVIEPPVLNPVLRIAPMSFLSFPNLTLGGLYQLQKSVAWYWSNQQVSLTATNALFTQMVAGTVSSGDYRLALNPVPAQAFATADVDHGFVVGATLTSGGSGYLTTPAVIIVGGSGSNATALANISGSVVTNITITNPGTGYTNTPTIEIAQPPAAAVSPAVVPMMRLDCANLAPYGNYQIQFKPDLGTAWGNWSGGSFSPTDVINSEYLFITNDTGFFRLQYVP